MSKVWVRNVRVANFHGFSRGRLALTGLTEGLNVVFAPNATGKSTLAKAIGLLFTPSDCPPGATVSSEIVDNGQELAREAHRKEQDYDGFPGKAGSYRLDLVNLLQGLQADAPLLDKVIGSGLKLNVGPLPRTTNLKEVKLALEKLQELRVARLMKASVADQEDRLPQLTNAVERSEEANENLNALYALIRRRQIQTQLLTLRAEKDALTKQYPGLEKQTDETIKTADLLADAVAKAQRDLEKTQAEFRRISPDLTAPTRELSDVDDLSLKNHVDLVSKSVREIETESRHLAELQTTAETARDQLLSLAPNETLDSLPAPTAADLAALRSAASQADAKAHHELQTETYRKMLDDWQKDQSLSKQQIEESLRLLRNWLEIEPTANPDRRPISLLAVIVVAALLLVALPTLPLRIVAALLAIAVSLYLFFAPPQANHDDRRREIESRFPKDLLQSEPSAASVSEAIARLLGTEAGLNVQSMLSTLVDQAPPTNDWPQRAANLRLKCGDPLVLAPVSQALATYLDCQTKVALQRQKLGDLHQADAALRTEMATLMSGYGYACAAGAELESARLFPNWFERSDALLQAKTSLKQAQGNLARRLDEFGAPPAADISVRRTELAQREPVAREHRTLTESEKDSVRELERIALDIKRLTALMGTADFDRLEIAALDELVERQRSLSQELKDRSMALVEAERKIKQAETESSIPAREADYQGAVGQVESKWKSLIRESVGRKAKQAIKDRLRKEDLPAVIERANDYANRFTAGRYKLAIAEKSTDGLGLLEVDDRERGRCYTFGELSTGTKVHIVVAIRLALIDDQERRANAGALRFPLIADEAMAVSDPDASKAIAHALAEISKDRQVIVFTNQPDDVQVFKAIDRTATLTSLGSEAIPEQNAVVDLPEYRRPPAIAIFDPRLPIGAHAPNAVFPKSVWNAQKPPERLSDATEQLQTLVEALEQARRALCRDNKRVGWTNVQGQPWAKTEKSSDLQAMIDNAKGCPHRILGGLKALSGRSFNQNRQRDAQEWLELNGYLVEPLTRDTIRQTISSALNGVDRQVLEHVTDVFADAFVPASQLSLL